jgi:serine/threonine protein kinase
MSISQSFAFDESDHPLVRRKKQAIFVVAGACCLAGCVWTLMYLAVFGWGLTAALPLAFVVIVGSALAISHTTKNYYYAVYAQIVCIMYITAFIQWSIGGLFDSGFVMAWAFCGPVSALVFFSLRQSAIWFVLYLVNVGITVAFDETFSANALEVSYSVQRLFFGMNLGVSSLVVILFAGYFARNARDERKRAEALQHDLDDERKKQLGQYTLEQKLGAGGMGVVYRASHALLRRPTAVKLLTPNGDSDTQLDRFEREVQLTSELSHPNIVAVYDYGRSPEGEFYYAMEYLPGMDLESLVEETGVLPPERVVPVLAQVADALDAAHHAGLVHRDIKPANIILSRFGKRADVVKVLDFGLVKPIDQDADLTADNVVCGTPTYLAPEALTAPDGVGPAADIYALGAVGYFLLVGHPVFDGNTVAEVCGHQIHTEPTAPSQASSQDIPPELDAILLRCLAKKPGDRFASAADVRDALVATPIVPWRAEDAQAWWNAFEDERSDVPTAPPPPSRKTMTVALRDKELPKQEVAIADTAVYRR